MAMDSNTVQLGVELTLDEADAAELDALTSRLRHELLQLDVVAVDRVYEGEPPPGARAVEVAALGTLIVKLVSTPTLLQGVLNAIQSWLRTQRRGSVRVVDGDRSILIDRASQAQTQQLIDDFIARAG